MAETYVRIRTKYDWKKQEYDTPLLFMIQQNKLGTKKIQYKLAEPIWYHKPVIRNVLIRWRSHFQTDLLTTELVTPFFTIFVNIYIKKRMHICAQYYSDLIYIFRNNVNYSTIIFTFLMFWSYLPTFRYLLPESVKRFYTSFTRGQLFVLFTGHFNSK